MTGTAQKGLLNMGYGGFFCILVLCIAMGVVLAGMDMVHAREEFPTGSMGSADAESEGVSPLRTAVEEQVRLLETEELDRFLRSLDGDMQEHISIRSVKDFIMDPDTGIRLEPTGFLRRIGEYLMREISFQTRLLGQIIVLAVLCALLHNFASILSPGASDLGFLVAYMVIIFLGVQSFHTAAAIGRDILSAMSSFMFALLPLLATMLAAVGAVTSAALFHPLLMTVVTLVVRVIEQIVFPLLFLSAIVGVIGQIVTEFPLTRLAQLFRQGAVTALGLFFTVFLGVMVIRGSIAPVSDGVALRTTKFLAGAVIPVVGGMMADAVEVVVGGSMLIKNALGVFGLVTLMTLLAFPLLKIFALVVIYRVATALVQPMSDPRLVEVLSVMASTLTSLMAAVTTAALMFFVVITVVIGIGNLTAIVR